MADLSQWLNQQIAEDERIASEAAQTAPTPWTWSAPFASWNVRDRYGEAIVGNHDEVEWDRGTPEHVVNWHPGRVLAECAMKRLLVKGHQLPHTCLDQNGWDTRDTDLYSTCLVLRHIAAAYTNRPGFQEEWRTS